MIRLGKVSGRLIRLGKVTGRSNRVRLGYREVDKSQMRFQGGREESDYVTGRSIRVRLGFRGVDKVR